MEIQQIKKKRPLQIANKCPVHKKLEAEAEISTLLKE
jgi:uncharacterized OsmC-like protein|tara:strand:- start:238 stop:348 length:111 start_codon:yes stop_codon:yes gene_type:complete